MSMTFEDGLICFKNYFLHRADVADQLAMHGELICSQILTTTALDALAKIWFHDFPEREKNLKKYYVQNYSEAIRLSLLLKEFAQSDPDASKVAVICFAEDWKRYRPEETSLANQLLSTRLSNDLYELPRSYLDVPIDKLMQECPQISQNQELLRIAEEYEYGAMLYKFFRCPLVHSSTSSNRTHGYTREEEIMYHWSDVDTSQTTVSFGPKLISRWLRTVAINYVQLCRDKAVIPANKLDAGLIPENKLKKRWENL